MLRQRDRRQIKKLLIENNFVSIMLTKVETVRTELYISLLLSI